MKEDDERAGRGRGAVRRGLLGLLLASLAGIAVWLLLPGAPSREAARAPARSPGQAAFERALDRNLEQLAQLREYQTRLQGLPRSELRTAVMELAVRGMPRLDDPLLLERAALFGRMIESVDVETCGAIVRGRAAPAQLERALEALDPRSVESWVDLCFRAAEAELRNVTAPALDPARTRLALATLVRRFPPEEGKRLAATLGRLREQNDADACWAARTVYQQVAGLGAPHDRMLARVLAQP